MRTENGNRRRWEAGQSRAELNTSRIAEQAKVLASHSWEHGTAAEALLELYDPHLSVFGDEPFPADKVPYTPLEETESLSYAKPHILLDAGTLIRDEHATGDPAALGVSAVLIGQSDPEYVKAAWRQAKHLLDSAPRWQNGAISHRKAVAELWADFGYMVPPFLAYYAIVSNEMRYMREAIDQCMLYHEVLSTGSLGKERGLWHHIVGPEKKDLGYWSTSNGWAAAGMARVLATMKKWKPTAAWKEEQQMLVCYIQEIIDGAMRTDDGSGDGLLRNYLGDESWFGEVSGTALLASVVYRVAVLEPEPYGDGSWDGYLAWAHSKRAAVERHVDAATGIAAPAVQPLDHLLREPLMTGSPEGQSFVVLLYAAYRDWSRNGGGNS
ncbi:hypothetical protein BDY21DRAFT_65950 [Lineolata rhizophorae]|uniref:Six-hairpin glycosidase-like protein n=1 Tax=Lineolata rhizophorae TaxID=578093 RepID=A0A6A6NVF8_9PEZI|nr:hypothetical protein BDY21DRAFT_65950 [Lineolata rhizophorae]